MNARRQLAALLISLTAMVGIVTAQGTPKQGVASQEHRTDARQESNSQNGSHPSSNVKISDNPTDSQSSKDGGEIDFKQEEVKIQRGMFYVTIILAGAGIIQFLVLIFTYVLMWSTARRQLRAYVVTELGYIVNVADPLPGPGPMPQTNARIIYPNGPVAQVQIKNTGQTPAFEVRHWGNICIMEFPLKSRLPSKAAEVIPIASILGPNISSTKRIEFPPLLTPQQLIDLRKGTIAIYVYGEITYRDAFKRPRITKYRLMHHMMGGVIGVSTDLNFAEDGNEAK
jgi:hypothetical protein